MTTKKLTMVQALANCSAETGLDITSFVLDANDVEHADSTQKLAYYHHLGLFRVRAVPDPDYSFADLCGDTYNPSACPDIPAAQLAREKAAFRSRVSRQGVWGFILEVRDTSATPWEDVDQLDSLWGNVGEDFIGSGYDHEFLVTALAWLEENKVVATDPQANLVAAAKKALCGMRAIIALHPEMVGDIQPYCKQLFDALDPYDMPGNLGRSPAYTPKAPPLRFDGHGLNLTIPGHQGERFATLYAAYKPNSAEGTDEQRAVSAEVLRTLESLGAVALKY